MSEWISVEKELPKNDVYVLAYSDDVYILKFNISNDKRKKIQDWYFYDPTGYTDEHEVSHWMRLPMPPKP